MSPEEPSIATLLRWLAEHHLTHAEFALLAGVEKSTVDGWCSNKPIGCKAKRTIRLAMELHTTSQHTETLLGIVEEQWTERSLYTESEWREICREAAAMGLTPGDYQRNILHRIARNHLHLDLPSIPLVPPPKPHTP